MDYREYLKQIANDQERLLSMGRRPIRVVCSAFCKSILDDVREGKFSGFSVESAVKSLSNLLLSSMVAGHYWGKYRVYNGVGKLSKKSLAFANLVGPYESAVDFVRKRSRMVKNEEALKELMKTYGDTALQVTRGLGKAVESRLQKATETMVSEGMHVDQAIKLFKNELTLAGVAPQRPYLVETLVRAQLSLAYGAGRWNALHEPDIDEIVWGYTYHTVGDDRVRPNHAALDGTTYPKDHPFWSTYWPPNGFACRCSVVESFEPQTIANPQPVLDDDGNESVAVPDEGWNYNPGLVFKDHIETE